MQSPHSSRKWFSDVGQWAAARQRWAILRSARYNGSRADSSLGNESQRLHHFAQRHVQRFNYVGGINRPPDERQSYFLPATIKIPGNGEA
jgi:hypothetical protein